MNERQKWKRKLDEEFYNDETSHFFSPEYYQDYKVALLKCTRHSVFQKTKKLTNVKT